MIYQHVVTVPETQSAEQTSELSGMQALHHCGRGNIHSGRPVQCSAARSPHQVRKAGCAGRGLKVPRCFHLRAGTTNVRLHCHFPP